MVKLVIKIGNIYNSFAKNEKNLYKILFMSQYNMFCDEFVKTDEYNFSKLQDLVKVITKLNVMVRLIFI